MSVAVVVVGDLDGDGDGDGNVEVDAVDATIPTLVYDIVDAHVMKLRKVLTDARYERGGQLLEGVVAMLTKMV